MSKSSSVLLRFALAFAFLYPAYGFWKSPADWVGYVPEFVRAVGLSQDALMRAIAGFHLLIALWLLSGWRIFLPSLVAAFFLFGIVYFNWNQLDILFRDLSLALAALALAHANFSRRRNNEPNGFTLTRRRARVHYNKDS